MNVPVWRRRCSSSICDGGRLSGAEAKAKGRGCACAVLTPVDCCCWQSWPVCSWIWSRFPQPPPCKTHRVTLPESSRLFAFPALDFTQTGDWELAPKFADGRISGRLRCLGASRLIFQGNHLPTPRKKISEPNILRGTGRKHKQSQRNRAGPPSAEQKAR